MKHYYKRQNAESGMTLMELSIALIVIGLLVTAYLQLYHIQNQKELKEISFYKLYTISDGLARYLSDKGSYPCPADRNKSINDTTAGEPGNCTSAVVAVGTCTAAYCVTNNPASTRRIRIGAIPFKALGIGPEDALDEYGRQYTYAVVEEQAVPATYSSNDTESGEVDKRDIILKDYIATAVDPLTGVPTAGSNADTAVDFIFFSHGKNGAGSVMGSGTPNPSACPASPARDSENCDNDYVFISNAGMSKRNDYTGDHDDSLVYNLIDWVYIWDTATEDTNKNSIYNRDSGNMGIGTEDGEEKLHVLGNVRVEEHIDETTGIADPDTGKVQAYKICDNDGTDCFEPEVLAGEEASTKRLQCPEGMVMSGVSNGAADCVSPLGTSTVACDSSMLSFVNSITVDVNGNITLGCDDI